MNRRGFLTAMLAAGMAPAIVKAANIMPIFARADSGLLLPTPVLLDYGGANFHLMRALLESARRKLPYFNGAIQPDFINPTQVRWERINFGSAS